MLSDPLNQRLPKWLRFGGEYRARVEGFTSGGFKPNNNDAYLLSRLRLNLTIRPENWLSFSFQAQDAHVFWKNQNPAAPPFQDAMDLRLGYVELGDLEKMRAGIRVGRQEMVFGDERLIGPSPWINTPRSFDGARGTYRKGGYRVDVFATRVVVPKDGQFDLNLPGNNFYGIYGSLTKLVPNAAVEPYFLWRRGSGLKTEAGLPGNIMNFGTYGFRWAGKVRNGWDYGVEMARQSGSLGSDSIGAWAGHWVVGRTFAARLHPRASLEYNYASGDHNSKDGRRGTFDQLYPSAHDKYGLADQVGWKNIRDARAGLELKPAKRLLLAERYNAWWLADSHDALYSATSSVVVARVAAGNAGRFVGQEFDSAAMFTLSRQLQFGGGFGHIFPGTFLKNATPGSSYNFPYASTTLTF